MQQQKTKVELSLGEKISRFFKKHFKEEEIEPIHEYQNTLKYFENAEAI